MIKAKRGDETKTFSKAIWEEMPSGKYGWKPLTEEPDEIKALREKKEAPADETKEASEKEASADKAKDETKGSTTKKA